MSVASPCVRNCCLDPNDVCLGCFRHIDEITGWTNRSDVEKLTVLEVCEQRRKAKASSSQKIVE